MKKNQKNILPSEEALERIRKALHKRTLTPERRAELVEKTRANWKGGRGYSVRDDRDILHEVNFHKCLLTEVDPKKAFVKYFSDYLTPLFDQQREILFKLIQKANQLRVRNTGSKRLSGVQELFDSFCLEFPEKKNQSLGNWKIYTKKSPIKLSERQFYRLKNKKYTKK
jgi:hypothetical protein